MKCKYFKSDGTPCGGYASKGSEYCYRHSPEISELSKKHASSIGGRHKLTPLNLPEIIVKDSRDIPLLLADTIYNLRRGKMDVRLGTAIGYVSNILLRSFETADLEVRIEKIEDFMHKHFNPEELNDC